MKKIIFFSIIALIVAFAAWYYFIRIDKDKAIKILYKANSTRDLHTLASFDEGFLIAAARATQKPLPTFEYEGKTYSTGTLKAA